MKVNFRKFPVYTSIRKEMVMEQDISFALANVIYSNVCGLVAHSLALRIYEDGVVELNEKEYEIILEVAVCFPGIVADSIKDKLSKNNLPFTSGE